MTQKKSDAIAQIFFGKITRADRVEEFIQWILSDMKVIGKIKIYRTTDNELSRIITFNVIISLADRKENLIRISSRSETNTLFTIGGLRVLTEQAGWTGNKFAFKPDWEQYRDCFVYEYHDTLVIRKLELEREIVVNEHQKIIV